MLASKTITCMIHRSSRTDGRRHRCLAHSLRRRTARPSERVRPGAFTTVGETFCHELFVNSSRPGLAAAAFPIPSRASCGGPVATLPKNSGPSQRRRLIGQRENMGACFGHSLRPISSSGTFGPHVRDAGGEKYRPRSVAQPPRRQRVRTSHVTSPDRSAARHCRARPAAGHLAARRSLPAPRRAPPLC